jgi:serine/threonine-protein kinase
METRVFSGTYRIEEEIARGGMGVIYRGLDLKLNRQVAIKVIHAHLSGDDSFAQRFLREARAMARLAHENIIRVYAVDEQDGIHYIVMEFFAGPNLRELLRSQIRLPVRQTLRIALQLAHALAYAHAQGIIHRDIKPANIMVDGSGKTKLVDFGIAAALDESSLTATGQVIGTPEYMAPEQARGEALDGRSDLYALGIVLYEMLVGHTPFHGVAKTVILGKLMQNRDEVPLDFPDDIPVALQTVVEALVRKDPSERIPDAGILAQQLAGVARAVADLSDVDQAEETLTILVDHTLKERKPTQQRPLSPSPRRPGSSERGTSPIPNVPDAPVELEKTDIVPLKKPASTVPHPPPAAERAFSVRLIAAGTTATVLLLAGLIYVLQSEGPSEMDHPSSSGDSPSRPAQETASVATVAGTESPPTSLLTKVEEERRRLSDDEARLAEKRERLKREHVRTQDIEPAIREQDRRTAAAKETERQRLDHDAERRKQADEQAKLDQERQRREAAEKEKAEADARLERERRLAAQEAERQRRETALKQSEEDAKAERERLAAQEADRQRRETAAKKAEEDAKAERERQAAQEADRQRRETALKKAEEDAKLERERQAAQEADRQRREAALRQKAEEEARLERDRQAAKESARRQLEAQARAEKEKASQQVASAQSIATAPVQQGGDVMSAQLHDLLKSLKQAYENQDLTALQRISEMSSSRLTTLQLLFDNYATIKVTIQDVTMTDRGATAMLTITDLVDASGKTIKPSPILRSTKLQIKRDGSEWTKVVW